MAKNTKALEEENRQLREQLAGFEQLQGKYDRMRVALEAALPHVRSLLEDGLICTVRE